MCNISLKTVNASGFTLAKEVVSKFAIKSILRFTVISFQLAAYCVNVKVSELREVRRFKCELRNRRRIGPIGISRTAIQFQLSSGFLLVGADPPKAGIRRTKFATEVNTFGQTVPENIREYTNL